VANCNSNEVEKPNQNHFLDLILCGIFVQHEKLAISKIKIKNYAFLS